MVINMDANWGRSTTPNHPTRAIGIGSPRLRWFNEFVSGHPSNQLHPTTWGWDVTAIPRLSHWNPLYYHDIRWRSKIPNDHIWPLDPGSSLHLKQWWVTASNWSGWFNHHPQKHVGQIGTLKPWCVVFFWERCSTIKLMDAYPLSGCNFTEHTLVMEKSFP